MTTSPEKQVEEVVYFVAVRTTAKDRGESIQKAMKALDLEGLLPEQPEPDTYPYAAAWYRPYAELNSRDHDALQRLGLDFHNANGIVTVVPAPRAEAPDAH
jgi:hypothetical protein